MNPGFFVCALAKIDVEVLKIPYSQDFLFYEIDVFKMQFNLMAEIKRISVSRYSILYSSTESARLEFGDEVSNASVGEAINQKISLT